MILWSSVKLSKASLCLTRPFRESIQKREELVLHMFRMKAAAAPCRAQEFEPASDAVEEKQAQ